MIDALCDQITTLKYITERWQQNFSYNCDLQLIHAVT